MTTTQIQNHNNFQLFQPQQQQQQNNNSSQIGYLAISIEEFCIKQNENVEATIELIRQFISLCVYKYKIFETEETLLMAIIYMKSLMSMKNYGFSNTVYSKFITSVMIAHKMLEDNSYNNESFAKLSQLNLQTINHNERQFLKAFEYNVNISAEQYQQLLSTIV